MAELIKISNAEWAVMEVVWAGESGGTAEVVHEIANARKWSHRTIRTLLARLVEKGALTATEDGNRYLYSPTVSRRRCVRSESKSFLEKVFGGDVSSLLMHFAKESQMPPADIERLKRMLNEKPGR